MQTSQCDTPFEQERWINKNGTGGNFEVILGLTARWLLPSQSFARIFTLTPHRRRLIKSIRLDGRVQPAKRGEWRRASEPWPVAAPAAARMSSRGGWRCFP